jgi:hypothetical protein
MGTKTEIWARLYIQPTSIGAGLNIRPFRLLSGSSLRFAIQIGNNQRIQVYDAANVFQNQLTTLVELNDWGRIEVRVEAQGAGQGNCDVWLYRDHTSTTHDELMSLTGVDFGSNFDTYQFGLTVGTVNFPTIWFDDVAIDDTAKIGPTGGGGGGAVDFTDGVSDLFTFGATGTLAGELVALTGGGAVEALFRSTPYARLWNNFLGSVSPAQNTVSNAAIMANNYVRVHAEGPDNKVFGNNTKSTGTGPTFAKRMVDAGVRWVTQYINGSYVTQNHFEEAPDLETQNPLGIAWFWPGSYSTTAGTTLNSAFRLTADMGTGGDTTFTVGSATTIAPSGLGASIQNIWPLRVSRGSLGGVTASTHSIDTRSFVSVVRIGNEIIGIPAAATITYNSGPNTIGVSGVVRGMWGTSIVTHSTNDRVYSPAYIGSVTGGADVSLAGSPAVGDDGTENPLRYCVRFGTVTGADWLGDRTDTQMGRTDPNNPWFGYNALHYDVSSSFFYNVACAYGTMIAPWNIDGAMKETSQSWATNQQFKFTEHAGRTGWSGITMFGNSVHRDPQDIGILATLDQLREGGGGTYEAFGKSNSGAIANGTTWVNEHANRCLEAMQENQTLQYWTRWDRDFNGQGNPTEEDRLQRMTYCTLLLCLTPGNTKYLYGVKVGMTGPDPIFYWDLGTPLESASTSISDLLDGTSQLYVREFANGWVLVNNSATTARTFTIPGTGHVVTTTTDASNLPGAVSSVQVPATDSRIVLKPGSPDEAPAPMFFASSGTTLQVGSTEQAINVSDIGPDGGVGEPELIFGSIPEQTITIDADLSPDGGVGQPLVAMETQTFFLPPAEIAHYSARDVPEAPSPAWRAFTRSWVGIDVVIDGVPYRGGIWSGPLTPAEIAAITAAGFGDRLAVVDNYGEFPVLDD